MTDKHLSSQFDAELGRLSGRLLAMGGQQVRRAVRSRMIGVALDYMFIAKAIERIGDHAKNIAEFVVYVVGGTDIRHAPKHSAVRLANS